MDAGTPVEVVDVALDPLGLPMRPLVAARPRRARGGAGTSAASCTSAFPDRFPVSENLRRIAESGTPLVVDDGPNSALVGLLARSATGPSRPTQVRERTLAALAEEIRLMLDEGVVAEAQDIDLCLILGAGWPFHLGGLTPYLDRTGVAERVTGQRFLPKGVASLP